MATSRYDWNGKGMYALDTRTGKEVVYAELDGVTIRETNLYDIRKLIFKTEGMKQIIRENKRNNPHLKSRDVEDTIERALKKAMNKRPKDFFGIEYIVEVDGMFVAYAEVTCYGEEPEQEDKLRKVFIGEKSYEGEDTYGGVDFFFVDKQTEKAYLQRVCMAFGHLCDQFGFFDHLDLVKITIGEDSQTKELVREVNIFGTIFDYAA